MKGIIEKINKINVDKFVSNVVITAVITYVFYSIMIVVGKTQVWANLPLLVCLGAIIALCSIMKKGKTIVKEVSKEVDLC